MFGCWSALYCCSIIWLPIYSGLWAKRLNKDTPWACGLLYFGTFVCKRKGYFTILYMWWFCSLCRPRATSRSASVGSQWRPASPTPNWQSLRFSNAEHGAHAWYILVLGCQVARSSGDPKATRVMPKTGLCQSLDFVQSGCVPCSCLQDNPWTFACNAHQFTSFLANCDPWLCLPSYLLIWLWLVCSFAVLSVHFSLVIKDYVFPRSTMPTMLVHDIIDL